LPGEPNKNQRLHAACNFSSDIVHFTIWCIIELVCGACKSSMYNSSLARLVTNSYEIFYDRTRKMWPFNTGDFFIEVTARAGVIVYTIISRVSIIYGSWMFWHFLLIAGCSLALKAKDDTRLHYTYIVEIVHCDTRVFQHPHVCPVLHVSLCTSTSHACPVLHVRDMTIFPMCSSPMNFKQK
jgi:hypothetical protein